MKLEQICGRISFRIEISKRYESQDEFAPEFVIPVGICFRYVYKCNALYETVIM